MNTELNRYRNSKAVKYDSDDEVYKMNLFVNSVMETLITDSPISGRFSGNKTGSLLPSGILSGNYWLRL